MHEALVLVVCSMAQLVDRVADLASAGVDCVQAATRFIEALTERVKSDGP